jgi:hypothetical protein
MDVRRNCSAWFSLGLRALLQTRPLNGIAEGAFRLANECLYVCWLHVFGKLKTPYSSSRLHVKDIASLECLVERRDAEKEPHQEERFLINKYAAPYKPDRCVEERYNTQANQHEPEQEQKQGVSGPEPAT